MMVRAFDITAKDEAIQTVDLKAGTWTFQAFVNADTYTIGLKDTLGTWHNYDLSDQTGIGWYDVEETFTTDFDAVELSLLNNVGTAQVLFPMIEKGARRSVKRPNDLDIEEAAIIKSASWEIHTSSPVIYKDAPDLTTDGVHTPVTVTGRHWVGSTMTEEGFITVTANDATEALTASPSPVTIAPADNADKHTYTIRLYSDANKTDLLDWETIPVVFKGAKGISAIRLHINNPVDVLPADSAGNVLTFVGTGTSIHVFEGAVELDYDGVGTTNGKFKVTAVATNITMGAITDSGNICVVADATAMPVAEEKASIIYTATGKTLDGLDFTVTGEQNFTKTKMGAKGDQGVQGIPGTGVISVRTEYYLSTDSTSQVDGTWQTTVPTWTTGTYIWERLVTVKDDSTETIGTPYLSQTWENINQLKADVVEEQAKTQFMTTIDGGLIYTALMKLFNPTSPTDENETAGISGNDSDPTNPAFYAGGTMEEAMNGTAKAIIRHDGSVKFTEAEITGTITSNSSGNRIVIDADDRNIKLIDSNDETLLNIGFKEIIDGDQTYNQPYIEQLSPSAYSFTPKSFFRPSFIELTNVTGTQDTSFVFDAKNSKIILGLSGTSPGTLKINIKNLPSSSSELSAGDLYRDSSGYLKIV